MSTYSQMNHKIIIGAALGISIAFIVATLGAPHLDFLLSVALAAFVLAIPLLLMAYFFFMLLGNKAEMEGTDASKVFRAARLLVRTSMIPVVVGFVAVLWHFGLIFVLVFFGSVALAFILYLRSVPEP